MHVIQLHWQATNLTSHTLLDRQNISYMTNELLVKKGHGASGG
jgi:hypothetical protein